MAFDKEEYWKNRKAGKRGQGEEPKPTRTELDTEKYAKLPNGMIVKKETLNDHTIHIVNGRGVEAHGGDN